MRGCVSRGSSSDKKCLHQHASLTARAKHESSCILKKMLVNCYQLMAVKIVLVVVLVKEIVIHVVDVMSFMYVYKY